MQPYVDREVLAGLLKSFAPAGSPLYEIAGGIEKGVIAFQGAVATTPQEREQALHKYVKSLGELNTQNNINTQGISALAAFLLLMAIPRR